MIVVLEAKQHIRNGATFAKMVNSMNKDVIYWLKYGDRDGFEIPNRTGKYLEKQGHKPESWRYTA